MPDFCNRKVPFHYATALNILMKMGIDINRVDLLAAGPYENYKGQIRSQEPSAGERIESDTRIRLRVGFSAPVDYMPYQFFYGLLGPRPTDRSWEERSRCFTAPADASLMRSGAWVLNQLLTYCGGLLRATHLRRILRLYDCEVPEGDLAELLFWSVIMPGYHRWAGNAEAVERILGALFGYRFEIVENVENEFEIPVEIRYHLGSEEGRLGRETVLGKSFREFDTTYRVDIEGVGPGEASSFFPGHSKRKKLEWVLGMVMPGHLDYRIRVVCDRSPARLAGDGVGSYIGQTSYL